MMADFGEILRAIGDFGLFQKLLLAGLSFPTMLLPMHFYSVVFTHTGFSYRCNTDWILKISPNLTTEEQLNLTLPRDQAGSFKRCEMFTPVDWDIDSIREHEINQTTHCLDGWVYDTSVYTSSIVSDFDLVCDKANFVVVAQTTFMASILLGSFIFGPLAESFGRKRGVQISIVLMAVFTVGTALSPNFYVYQAALFIVGVSYGGYRINGILLATEWIGLAQRTYPSALCRIFAGIGQCVLAGIAYFFREWRTVQLIIASPLALVIIYIWLVPESARWLLDRGKTEEAEKVILMVAAVNRRKIPDNILEKVVDNKKGDRGTIRDLFTSPLLRKYLFTVMFSWFSVILGYHCISLNVGEFGMDIFLTQLIFGLTEIPTQMLGVWLMETLGRKLSAVLSMMLGGFFSLLILAVPQDNAIAITGFATTGRLSMGLAGTVFNVYVQELFPTSIRQTANGLGIMAIRVAGLLSPIINTLAVYHRAIPILIYSSLCIASAALCFLLPETRSEELPDSTEDLEIKKNPRRAMNGGKNKTSQPNGDTHLSYQRFT
ncbi:hypothetical protein SKAU_G00308610 [Synaphobranchus kaupii]|uniref:Major facilitator superfamily (MFS) profile domain-containing protein n=1 Tax=Synaphobranchus kaupii TaxID=118154 RepID=A0A9Q1ERA6_SYNKA|nr:hypothetical protein SKAU_G00308610 [Synaphobranchus kaupii]